MGSLRLAHCGHRWGAPAAHSCWTRSRRTQPGPASSDQSGGRQRVLRQAGDGLQRGSTGARRQPPPLQAQRRQRELDAWGRPAPDWELPTSDAEESDADLFPEVQCGVQSWLGWVRHRHGAGCCALLEPRGQ